MTECSRKKRTAILILALITLGGMVLRLASCFWGYPMALHPDEFTIVDNAIDMLRRHSWLALSTIDRISLRPIIWPFT